MSYALATCSTVPSGSSTRTTPPWPVQYRVPDASMDITRSLAGAPAAPSAAPTDWKSARRLAQAAWVVIEPATPTTTAKHTAAVMKTRSAAARSQVRRRAAIQATTAATPSSASTYAPGASATAEWMNVPPGTWTADTIAEKANRIAA